MIVRYIRTLLEYLMPLCLSMTTQIRKLLPASSRRHKKTGAKCPVYDVQISSLADYFGVFDKMLSDGTIYWFRGHSNFNYDLVPSALRHNSEAKRQAALDLVAEFRRNAEFRLHKPPASSEELKWIQLAQHYGLGSRLLDWTENAAVALYFACQSPQSGGKPDGTVFVLQPLDLNLPVDSKRPRIFDAQVDCKIIEPYLSLSARTSNRGRKPTIAIHPIWNSDRIILQKGAFTLHGNVSGGLNYKQAPNLVKVPIIAEFKPKLLQELDRIGISENTIFPELEHLCNHLVRKNL